MTHEEFVALVRSYVGKTAKDPEYVQLIAPWETAARAAEMVKESDCILAILGFLRLAGVDHPLLSLKYVTGKAPEWLFTIARHFGALLVPPFAAGSFVAGDIGIVDGDTSAIHGFTFVEVADQMIDSEIKCTSVDGGQRTFEGTEEILQVERVISLRTRQPYDRRESPPPMHVRRFTHAIDVTRLLDSADPYA